MKNEWLIALTIVAGLATSLLVIMGYAFYLVNKSQEK